MSFGSTSYLSDHSTALRTVSVRPTETRRRSALRRTLPSTTYPTLRSRPTSAGDGVRAKGEGADRPRDVLHLLLPEIVENHRELVADLIADRPRNAQAAGLRQGFQPRRHVDAVAENVVRLDDDVADIDADAEYQP